VKSYVLIHVGIHSAIAVDYTERLDQYVHTAALQSQTLPTNRQRTTLVYTSVTVNISNTAPQLNGLY